MIDHGYNLFCEHENRLQLYLNNLIQLSYSEAGAYALVPRKWLSQWRNYIGSNFTPEPPTPHIDGLRCNCYVPGKRMQDNRSAWDLRILSVKVAASLSSETITNATTVAFITINSTTTSTTASINQYCDHNANFRWYPSPTLVDFLWKKRPTLDFHDEDRALEVSCSRVTRCEHTQKILFRWHVTLCIWHLCRSLRCWMRMSMQICRLFSRVWSPCQKLSWFVLYLLFWFLQFVCLKSFNRIGFHFEAPDESSLLEPILSIVLVCTLEPNSTFRCWYWVDL